MEGPQIEYNREHVRLESALKAIDRPGDYFVAGRVEGAMPRMSVRPVGTIAFPILEAQARSLADAADRAPYGRGPDTVLDPSVRNCWQIDANRVQLSGASWEKTFRSILESVADGLGCPRDGLSAQLYKLLVYEQGGFFSEHRDTEKVDGMIATLVVALPTAGQGGELVVRHLDREATIDLQVDELGELAYAAFYADCVHRTKPVESGHRVSLVFNVIMKPSFRSALPGLPDYSGQINEISGILSEWAETGQGPRKIVWLLEHAYSQVGLSQSTFKGLDDTVGQALARAADRSGCVLHGATLSIEESCLPEDEAIGGYGLQIDFTGRSCPIEEVFESSYTLESWAEPDLTGSELPEIPLLEEEALPAGSLDDAEPDEQTLFEASGNEGVSLERSYRLAAFVLWPRSREVSVIADGSIDAAIQYAERMLAIGQANRDAPVTGGELVSKLIDCWPQERRDVYSRPFPVPFLDRGDKGDRSLPSMLELLSRVSDEEQSARFLCEVVAKQYDAKMNDALVPFLRTAKRSTLVEFLPAFMQANIPLRPGDALALLTALRMNPPGRDRSDWEGVLRVALRAAVQALPEAVAPTLAEGEPEWRRPKPQTLDADNVCDLFAASHSLALDSESERATDLMSRYPEQVDPVRTIPKALNKLCRTVPGFGRSPAFVAMWHHSSRCLLERSATPPEAPADERIEAPIPCPCDYCEELKAFCLDREAKTKRFRAIQDVRRHIESSIARANLDIDYRTETYGRPYTLVCEKVPKSYRGRVDRHAGDIDHMRILSQATPSDDSLETTQALARLHEALARQ